MPTTARPRSDGPPVSGAIGASAGAGGRTRRGRSKAGGRGDMGAVPIVPRTAVDVDDAGS